MELSQLHFAHPLWLWVAIAIPIVGILFYLFFKQGQPIHQLEKFIDKHLLPYVLVNQSDKKQSYWKSLLLWSFVWACLTISLAGPRWSFREMETFSRDQSLVILLDLSESMNATDIKPSRLIRAKQKIEDLINDSSGVKIGLLAFAADPHMIAPITDDKETIRHLLPTLETDLVYVQGSKLSSALDMASVMLDAEPGSNKALLIISDGGFEDASSISTAKKLADKGIIIYTMGVGTAEGAPLQDHAGTIVKKNGAAIISKLETEKLNEISRIGNGHYLDIQYSNEGVILRELENHAEAQVNVGIKNKYWDEHFYLFIIPILPFILWWFRRGYVLNCCLLLLMPIMNLEAASPQGYFKNKDEFARDALDEGDYESAIQSFDDPYRKGVAYYKSGNFSDAERMFRLSNREDVACNSGYNLGNCLVFQQKLKEAITAYEDVLKEWPDHQKTKDNLEIVKKMLEQQQQESSDSDKSDSDKSESDKSNKSDKSDSDKSNKSDEQDKNNSEGSKSSNKNESQSSDSKNKQDQKNDKKNQNDKQDSNQKEKEKGQQGQQEQCDPNEGKENQGNQDQANQGQSNQEQAKQNELDQKEAEKREAKEKEAKQGPSSENKESEKVSENGKEEALAQPLGSENEEAQEAKSVRSQEDQDADIWLNRISNDQKSFMKNKFYIESKRNGTTEGIDPW